MFLLPTPNDALTLLAQYLGVPAALLVLFLNVRGAMAWAKLLVRLPATTTKAAAAADQVASFLSQFRSPRSLQIASAQALFVSSGFVLSQLIQAVMGLDYIAGDGSTKAELGSVTTDQVVRALLSYRFTYTTTALSVLLVVVILWVVDEVFGTSWVPVPAGAVTIASAVPVLVCFAMGVFSIFGAIVGGLVETGDEGFSDWATVRNYAVLGVFGSVVWPATLYWSACLYRSPRLTDEDLS